jgi:Holliday junction resolvase RusA-like endonuclease
MLPLTIELDALPQGKERPRSSFMQGRVYTPAKTVAFEQVLAFKGREVMRSAMPFECALRITITQVFPIPPSWPQKRRYRAERGLELPTVKPDFDNIGKIVGDALNKIVWRDDAQITDGRVIKRYCAPSEKPTLVILVERQE